MQKIQHRAALSCQNVVLMHPKPLTGRSIMMKKSKLNLTLPLTITFVLMVLVVIYTSTLFYQISVSNIYEVGADNSFSINALFRGDFKWPIIDDSYLDNAIAKLDELMFFDDDEIN
jgi:hypothetical protein